MLKQDFGTRPLLSASPELYRRFVSLIAQTKALDPTSTPVVNIRNEPVGRIFIVEESLSYCVNRKSIWDELPIPWLARSHRTAVERISTCAHEQGLQFKLLQVWATPRAITRHNAWGILVFVLLLVLFSKRPHYSGYRGNDRVGFSAFMPRSAIF